jgi:hypothetical protein
VQGNVGEADEKTDAARRGAVGEQKRNPAGGRWIEVGNFGVSDCQAVVGTDSLVASLFRLDP